MEILVGAKFEEKSIAKTEKMGWLETLTMDFEWISAVSFRTYQH